jgi:hypothetical protein
VAIGLGRWDILEQVSSAVLTRKRIEARTEFGHEINLGKDGMTRLKTENIALRQNQYQLQVHGLIIKIEEEAVVILALQDLKLYKCNVTTWCLKFWVEGEGEGGGGCSICNLILLPELVVGFHM